MRWRALQVTAGSIGGAVSQVVLVGALLAAVLCAAYLVVWRAQHRRAGAAGFCFGLGVGLPRRAGIGSLLLVAAAVLLAVGFAVAQWVGSSPSASASGLDSVQERNARIIIGVATARGLGGAGAAIGVAAALAESSLYNYANDGTSTLVGTVEGRQLTAAEHAVARESLNYPHDRVGDNLDSIGLFQQRPMSGWGPPRELIDPATSAGLFFDRLVQIPGWQSMPAWTVAQRVQGSSSTDGGIYRQVYPQAVRIVTALAAPAPASGLAGAAPATPPL
ncbi:MAG TPA: hypothetical protein VIJ23_02125 [Mycobacterium sp.]